MLKKDNLSCTARDILNYKTPYLIAKNIENKEDIVYDAVEGAVDLLPIQSYYFNEVNNDEYSQEFILRSNIKLNLNILQNAFDNLTVIHDMLRAIFKVNDNEVIQEIMPINSRVCQINEIKIEDSLNDAIKQIIIDSKSKLNINSKLMDITLVNYNGEFYLIFVIHHLIVDGVSWSIILDE